MNRSEQGDYSHRRTGGALKFRWKHDQRGFVGPSISQLVKFHVLDDVDPLVNEQMLAHRKYLAGGLTRLHLKSVIVTTHCNNASA